MTQRVEFRGASGRSYSFLELDGEAALRHIGVTYVVAEHSAAGWQPLFVGHTNDLADMSWASPLADMRRSYSSAEVFIRLNISRSVREAEHTT